jgi:hypothetical protein
MRHFAAKAVMAFSDEKMKAPAAAGCRTKTQSEAVRPQSNRLRQENARRLGFRSQGFKV